MKSDLHTLLSEQIGPNLVLINRVVYSNILIYSIIKRDKHHKSKGWYQKHNKSKKRYQR